MNQHTPVPLKQDRGWGWLQEKVRHKEELSGLAQGGDIAMSVGPAGRRPHGCPGKHVWNGGCLSEIPRLGRAGSLAGGQSHRAGCLGWMQNRGVVPGAGQEQHEEARKHSWVGSPPSSCALQSHHGALAT